MLAFISPGAGTFLGIPLIGLKPLKRNHFHQRPPVASFRNSEFWPCLARPSLPDAALAR